MIVVIIPIYNLNTITNPFFISHFFAQVPKPDKVVVMVGIEKATLS